MGVQKHERKYSIYSCAFRAGPIIDRCQQLHNRYIHHFGESQAIVHCTNTSSIIQRQVNAL